MSNKRSNKIKIVLLVIALLVILVIAAVLSAERTYRDRYDNEIFDDIDMYSMHEYSEANSKAVLNALKSQDAEALSQIMISTDNLSAVIGFADWSSMDIDNAISMGSGSLSAAANSEGYMDIAEKIVVDTSDGRYVFYIETLASRWGRNNDGVSAISVTTYDYFDAVEYDWLGEPGEESVCAGKLFWQQNQTDGAAGPAEQN